MPISEEPGTVGVASSRNTPLRAGLLPGDVPRTTPREDTLWRLSYRADPITRAIADRHYNRQKPGTAQFVPPGRCLVLEADGPGFRPVGRTKSGLLALQLLEADMPEALAPFGAQEAMAL